MYLWCNVQIWCENSSSRPRWRETDNWGQLCVATQRFSHVVWIRLGCIIFICIGTLEPDSTSFCNRRINSRVCWYAPCVSVCEYLIITKFVCNLRCFPSIFSSIWSLDKPNKSTHRSVSRLVHFLITRLVRVVVSKHLSASEGKSDQDEKATSGVNRGPNSQLFTWSEITRSACFDMLTPLLQEWWSLADLANSNLGSCFP